MFCIMNSTAYLETKYSIIEIIMYCILLSEFTHMNSENKKG